MIRGEGTLNWAVRETHIIDDVFCFRGFVLYLLRN